MTTVVADIGGTSTRVATAVAGSVHDVRVFESPSIAAGWPADRIPAGVTDIVADYCAERAETVRDIVVAFPGPITSTGRILSAPTLWRDHDLSDEMHHQLDTRFPPEVTVHLLNDVTAAGYALVAAGETDFLLVTVSSGIGAKLFLDGRPLLGDGLAGEIGHVVSSTGTSAPCECGGIGHIGGEASGRGLATASVSGRTEHLLDQVLAGDANASATVGRMSTGLAHALCVVRAATGVDRFFVMGGVASHLGDRYVPLVAARAATQGVWTVSDWVSAIRLHPSEQPGLVGAAAFASLRARSGARC